MKDFAKVFLFLLILLSIHALGVTGKAFFDLNANGVFDNDEKGLAGCLISDGKVILSTDDQGTFSLDTDQPFVFVILPDGYTYTNRWYASTKESEIHFGLTKCVCNGVFAVVADLHYAENPEIFSQALKDRSMKYCADEYMEKLVRNLSEIHPSFVIVLGDLGASVRDISDELAQGQLLRVKNYMNRIGTDVFYAVGNHEFNSKIQRPVGIYEDIFGPRYYSFNRCGAHFVVLDTHSSANGSLIYGIDDMQLDWLKNDLTLVRDDQRIIVLSHEPLYDLADSENNRALRKMFVDLRITAHISGHWHSMIRLSDYPYLQLTCGAVSGAWWEGPSPTGDEFGYTLFEMDRNSLNYAYIHITDEPSVWFEFPLDGILSGIVPFRIVTSKFLQQPTVSIDGSKLSIQPIVIIRKSWTEYVYYLNVSYLDKGVHDLILEDSESAIRKARSFWVDNRFVTFEQMKDYAECFQGRLVTVVGAKPVAKYGSSVSFHDGTDGLMVKMSSSEIVRRLADTTTYNLTGIAKDPWATAEPLRIYLDEGLIQK